MSAVRVVGIWVYLGAGSRLRLLDVTNPAAPVAVTSISTDRWVMGLAVGGSVCAVTTDGSGVRLYDVAGAAPVLQSSILAVTRPLGVAIDGKTLYIAGADTGLHVYDITDPAMPTPQVFLPTTPAAYHVTASGTHAYLSVGGRVLAVGDPSGAHRHGRARRTVSGRLRDPRPLVAGGVAVA